MVIENERETVGYTKGEDVDEEEMNLNQAEDLEEEAEDEPLDHGLDVQPEGVSGEEATDDPIRMYLHEIGRVPLLNAANEKVLAQKMELGRRINAIRKFRQRKLGRMPTATEILMSVLKRVGKETDFIETFARHLALDDQSSLNKLILSPELKKSFCGGAKPELVQAVADELGKTPPEVDQMILTVAPIICLIPRELREAIGEGVKLREIGELAEDPAFIASVQI